MKGSRRTPGNREGEVQVARTRAFGRTAFVAVRRFRTTQSSCRRLPWLLPRLTGTFAGGAYPGVGLALLLVYGALNGVSAVAVPVALEARAVHGLGDGAVLLANGPEEFMLGTTYTQLHRDNPKLDKLLVDTMLGMCAQMMAMAVAFLAIAWFAARRDSDGRRGHCWSVASSGCRTTSHRTRLRGLGAAMPAGRGNGRDIRDPGGLGAILMIVARDTSLPVLTHRGD